MRLADGSVAGFGALLRWRHPARGLISPSDFIAHSEETGIIEGKDKDHRWIIDPIDGTILGAQGTERITVGEFCAWADCIPWEALCTLTQRVQRVYRTDRT